MWINSFTRVHQLILVTRSMIINTIIDLWYLKLIFYGTKWNEIKCPLFIRKTFRLKKFPNVYIKKKRNYCISYSSFLAHGKKTECIIYWFKLIFSYANLFLLLFVRFIVALNTTWSSTRIPGLIWGLQIIANYCDCLRFSTIRLIWQIPEFRKVFHSDWRRRARLSERIDCRETRR